MKIIQIVKWAIIGDGTLAPWPSGHVAAPGGTRVSPLGHASGHSAERTPAYTRNNISRLFRVTAP